MWNSIAAWLRDVLKFPYREFEIDTQLSDEQVEERLRAIVEPGTVFSSSFKRTNKLFAGEVSRSAFKIVLMRAFENSLMVSVGCLERSPDGTRIRITMRLTARSQVFLAIWFGFLALVFLTLLISILFPDPRRTGSLSNALFGLEMAAAMAGGAALLVAVNFGMDARKVRGLLEEALHPKIGPRVQKAIESKPRLTLRFWMFTIGSASSVFVLLVVLRAAPKRSREQAAVPYRTALDYIRSNPTMVSEVGAVKVIKLDRSTYTTLSITGDEGSASLAFDVQGSRDQGIAFVHLKEHRGFWFVNAAGLQESDGKIIELKPDAGSP